MGRKRKPWFPLMAAGLVMGLFLSGCKKSESLLHQPANEQQIKNFFSAKEAQARQLVSLENQELPPEIWRYFKAGRNGDWAVVTNLYAAMGSRCYQFDGNKEYDQMMRTMAWQAINETDRFYLQCTQPDSKYALAFGEEVMRLVPPGSIYFGDTDAGRFIPTALCRDHSAGDPFFVLTQNALADSLYQRYLQNMFGTKIHVLDISDLKNVFDEYMKDVTERMQKGQLLSGEDIKKEQNQISVSGQTVIMIINSRLSKLIFDRNPQREFFVAEGFPALWMYPHLEPYGPILKINRDKPPSLAVEIIQRDKNYWNEQMKPFIGDWLKEETSLKEICQFVEKAYIRQDFTGFTGDRDYIRMATFWRKLPAYSPAASIWSKSRAAHGGVYVWRLNDAAAEMKTIANLPEEQRKQRATEFHQLQAEQQQMLQAADFAYRQAFALNPSSPEAVYRYCSLLASLGRYDEALMMVQTAKPLNPEAFAPLEKQLLKKPPKEESAQKGAGSP